MQLTAGEIARAAGGTIAAGEGGAIATSYAIDSRVVEPGACFVALVARRDGHDFVDDAFRRGATVALVGRVPAGVEPGRARAIVRVPDPLRALGDVGALARRRLHDATVVGITGSAGKTGTKDLTAAVLARKFLVHASPGSYNNEAGVPLTLASAPAAAEALVLEMGARAAGDIAALCELARPTVGVVTNVGLAHAGRLGGLEGVRRVKGELVEALDPSGLAVLDAGDPSTDLLAARTRARVLRVSVGVERGAADVVAADVSIDGELRPSFTLSSPWGSAHARLALRGEHHVVNAALAAAVGLARGVPVDEVAHALESVCAAAWRMELVRSPRGVTVLNDAYNANPASMAAALQSLARLDVTGRRFAVLGDMLELGAESEAEHAKIGRLAAESGVDVLVTVGSDSVAAAAAARNAGGRAIEVIEAADAPTAAAALRGAVGPGDAVLVKGSRALGLEHVAETLGGEPAP